MRNAPQRRALRPLAPAPAPTTEALPQHGSVRWFTPDEDLTGELVLSGTTGAAFEQLARELRHTDDFLRAGLDPSTRILLGGPSGTGKTLSVRWLGWTLKLPVAVIDVSSVVAPWLGETSGGLGEIFKTVEKVPAVLFFDEIDAICCERSHVRGGRGSGGEELARATTVFLQHLDWLRPSRIVVAATNFPDDLDSALRRRLTTEVAFEVPDRDARARMLAKWLARTPLSSELIAELLDATEGLSGADLRSRAMARARAHLIERFPKPVPEPPPAPPKTVREQAQELLLTLERMGST